MPISIQTSRQPWVQRPTHVVRAHRGHPLARGLETWWPLHRPGALIGTPPTTATQSYGSGAPIVGQAGYYNGAVYTAGATPVGNDVPHTISLWARHPGALGLTTMMCVNVSNQPALSVWWWSSGNGLLVQSALDATTSRTAEMAAAVDHTQWHLYTITWDGSTNRPVIYVDGRANSQNGSAGLNATGDGIFVGVEGVGSYYATQYAADFRQWSRALSAAEIWALYDPRTRWELYQPVVRRVYVEVAGGGGGTYNESPAFAASASLGQAAAVSAATSTSYAASVTLGQAGTVSAPVALSYAAAVALAQAVTAAAAGVVGFAATAAQLQAATAAASAALAFAGTPAITFSDGSTQTVDEDVTYAATAAHAMSAAASAEALAAYLATAALAQAGQATGTATVTLTAAAAHSHAVSCVASMSQTFAALATLLISDGTTQTVSESVTFAAVATHGIVATAVASAVQAYLATAGLTHSTAATAGAALALDVQAALSHSPSALAQAAVTLEVAAAFAASAQATGDITYTVLRVAAETLRAARATSETLRAARATGETLH